MSWDMVGNEKKSNKGDEVKYLKFEEGTTIIRLLDEAPESYFSHWIARAQGGKGIGIACCGKGCPICEEMRKEKAQKVDYTSRKWARPIKHMINVLVKKSNGKDINEVMVLEQGNGLFGQIKEQMTLLSTMGMSTNLMDYDIIINRTGTGFGDTKYSVMVNPMGMKPLTDEEKALKKYDLTAIKPAYTPEQIIMYMNGSTFDEVNAIENKDIEQPVNATHGMDFSDPF